MRISLRTYGFIIFVLLMANGLHAQNLQKKISLNLSNSTLKTALNEIGREGNIHFSYNPSKIPLEKTLSYTCKNKPVRDVLNDILNPMGITWSLVEKQVVLKSSKKPEKEKAPDEIKYTLSGYVSDSTSGEVLIGATVHIDGTTIGTICNSYGFYSLTLPPGKYNIVYSYIGYKQQKQEFEIRENRRHSTNLSPSELSMNVVIVSAKEEDDWRENIKTGVMRIDPKTVQEMPGFAGESDPIKSLQSVPGIISHSDGSSIFYVRGGKGDQNLILIDEAPVYNASHLFGFFTSLVPDAIKNIDVYKGDFPAQYGGRLSSVVDMQMKDGNMQHFSMNGSTNQFATNLAFEGPFKKDVSSYYIALRTSNLGWINRNLFSNRELFLGFSDFNAKFNIKLNRNNRLFLTVYGGNDRYFIQNSPNRTFGINWTNNVGTLRWNHVFNNKLFCNTTFIYSRYNYFIQIWKEHNDYWSSHMYQGTLKSDFSWFVNPRLMVRSGWELNAYDSDPGNIHLGTDSLEAYLPLSSKYLSINSVLYASAEQQLGNKFFLNYGLRYTAWSNTGATTVYYFDDQHQVNDTIEYAKGEKIISFLSLEPRFSAAFVPKPGLRFKFAYTRNTQFLQILNNSLSPFTTTEAWMPPGPNIAPQTADNISLGYYNQNLIPGMQLSIEGFGRRLYHQIDYSEHASLLFNPLLEGEVNEGEIESFGVETMIRKKEGKLRGWIGYTFSKTRMKNGELNSGIAYPTLWDRPHNINFHLSWTPSTRWEMSVNWTYSSGMPFTSPTGFYYYNNMAVPIYNELNNSRLPDYHRLDISARLQLNKTEKKYNHFLELAIYNLYARHNPVSMNYNKIVDDNGNFLMPMNFSEELNYVPVSMAVAGFIPSLTYQFKLR
jgi:hypothetical protein